MKYITSAEEIQYFENEYDNIFIKIMGNFEQEDNDICRDVKNDEVNRLTIIEFQSKFGFDFSELND